MHTLQHGLIAILTDSCSTVVPQYKKKRINLVITHSEQPVVKQNCKIV